jgi:hypothetical protein
VIGDRDETYANNVAFHEHLASLGIAHEWRVLRGIGHDPMAVLRGLDDAHWAFYRRAFGAPAKPADTSTPPRPGGGSERRPQGAGSS